MAAPKNQVVEEEKTEDDGEMERWRDEEWEGEGGDAECTIR